MARYCHCASIITGAASLHLPWIASELTPRATFKEEQFPSGQNSQLRRQNPVWAFIIGFTAIRQFSFTAFCAALHISCSCAQEQLQALILGSGNQKVAPVLVQVAVCKSCCRKMRPSCMESIKLIMGNLGKILNLLNLIML